MRLKMKRHDGPGLLITFCGLDGCGKTTQLDRCETYLRALGLPVLRTKQPTSQVRTSVSFRTYMDMPGHEEYDYRALSLFAASDRLQHSYNTIEPALNAGTIVLSDRYFYSCLANLRARGYTSDRWIYDISRHITQPDLALFFDLDWKSAVRRVRLRPAEKDRYIDLDLQQALEKQYRLIAQENGGIIIPTAISMEESFTLMCRALDPLIEEHYGVTPKSALYKDKQRQAMYGRTAIPAYADLPSAGYNAQQAAHTDNRAATVYK